MDSNTQLLFNILVGIAGALGGFFIHVLWKGVTDLQSADKALAENVANLHVMVAGEYVKRNELKELTAALFAKLDRIESKLDGKVDKP